LIDGFDHVGGRVEVEVQWVADVEGEDFVSLAGDFVGDAGEVADGVADVFETGGWGDFAELCDGHEEILTAEGAEDPMKCNFFPNLQFAAKTSGSGNGRQRDITSVVSKQTGTG